MYGFVGFGFGLPKRWRGSGGCTPHITKSNIKNRNTILSDNPKTSTQNPIQL